MAPSSRTARIARSRAIEFVADDPGVADTVDVGTVAVPVAVTDDGSVAITTEQNGTVTLWWVPEGEAIVTFTAVLRRTGNSSMRPLLGDVGRRHSTPPGSLAGTRRSQMSASPGRSSTRTSISWLARTCDLAGRPLTTEERAAAGFPDGPGVCG